MSGLVQRAAAGDLAAAEELRSVLSEGPRPEVLWSGKTDSRRKMQPTLEESTGKTGDDLFTRVLTNWLGLHGSEPASPPLPGGVELLYLPAEAVAAERAVSKERRLKLPWVNRGKPHPDLLG